MSMRKNDPKDGFEGRRKGIFWQIFPLASVVLILLVGYQSVDLVKHLLPDYRGEIVTHEKTDKNSPIYLQEGDAIAIYPWDEYDENKVYVLAEALRAESVEAVDEMKALMEMLVQHGAFFEERTWVEYLSVLAPALVPEYDLQISSEAYSQLTFADSTIYLRDSTAAGKTGSYKVDMSIDFGSGGLFYHIGREEKAELTLTEINTASQKLQEALDEFRAQSDLRYTLRNAASVAEVEKSLDPEGWGGIVSGNPVLQVIYRLRWKTPEVLGNSVLMWDYALEIDNILCTKQAAAGENLDIVVYQGELLAIFTESDGTRLVLYYDPLTEQICGLSLERP